MSWMIAILVFGIGLAAGMLLNYTLSRDSRQLRDLEKQLDKAREEHATYRREVSDHFTQTALAVNRLTESYRSVHEQLSDGAHRLCDNAAAESALAFDQSRLIGEGAQAQADDDTPAAESSATGATPSTEAASPDAEEINGPETPKGPPEPEEDAPAPPRDYAEAPPTQAGPRAR